MNPHQTAAEEEEEEEEVSTEKDEDSHNTPFSFTELSGGVSLHPLVNDALWVCSTCLVPPSETSLLVFVVL